MKKEQWKEPKLSHDTKLVHWMDVDDAEFKEIEREALRYCPEFPFKPVPQETSEREYSFYEDYRLVLLASASGDETSAQRKEVYGFYAPGDFRPLDGFGRTIELLNKLAPLRLTTEAIMDYALLRLRFELPNKFVDNYETAAEWRLAEIVSELDDLPFDKDGMGEETLAALRKLLAKPQIEAASNEESEQPQESEQDKEYRVSASAVIYSEAMWRLISVSVQVAFDGTLTWDAAHEQSRPLPLGRDKQPAALIFSPLRARVAMPIREWHKLGNDNHDADPLPEPLQRKLGNKHEVWHTRLREKYDVGKGVNVRRVILRVADLTFYRTFCLLEVQERLSESYRRSYALIRQHEGKLDVRSLNGKSPIIHSINAEDDKPIISAQEAEEYLRFFCWAVHGPEGPFYLPRKLRELPFTSAPGPDQIEILRKLGSSDTGEFLITDEKVQDIEYPEIKGEQKKAYIFYSTGMFEAWFNIEWTGMVTMVEDAPRAQDLAIEREVYGENDLFILDTRPKPQHYLQDSINQGAENISTSHEDKQKMGVEDFLQELEEGGMVSKREMSEPVIFDDTGLPREEGNEETS